MEFEFGYYEILVASENQNTKNGRCCGRNSILNFGIKYILVAGQIRTSRIGRCSSRHLNLVSWIMNLYEYMVVATKLQVSAATAAEFRTLSLGFRKRYSNENS